MSHRHIEILRITPLRGPSIWTYRPALEAWVDIGDLEDSPSHTIPGFVDRLVAWLPSLVEHHCSEGTRGGFIQRLREGTWPAHIMEHVTLELQNLIGQRTGFGKARSTSQRGIYRVVVRSRQEEVTRACLYAARDLVMAAIDDRPFDLPATLSRLAEVVEKHCLGPSTACIVDAASERGIPWIRLNDGNLVQLGYGSRQRRIWTAETDSTSAIAESIASDKDLTKRLLQSCGVPVPEGQVVGSPEEAWEAAEDIGLPVVVKPSDGNHGRGVSLDLSSREDVMAAYTLADEHGSEVLVERYIRGDEHRLLVVGGKLVAAARGESAWIVGDGRLSVQALIDQQINTDPRRGEGEEFPLTPVRLDDPESSVRINLQRQGLSGESVPAAGQRVMVVPNGNLAIDCTAQVHPKVAAMAALAARIVGLDIAGVDLVAEDIGRPLHEQGGAIVEVNAGPGLLMHLKPALGTPQPVGAAIVEHLFANGEDGRIPVVGVAGSAGTTPVARLIHWLLHLDGRRSGLACSDGIYLGRRQVERVDGTRWEIARRLMINRTVEAAVVESSVSTILGEGLAYDRCAVGVVTSIAEPKGLEAFDVNGIEQVATAIRTQVDVVLPGGAAVLNAQDERVAALAGLSDGEVIFHATDDNNAVVLAHVQAGGRAVVLVDGAIQLLGNQAALTVVDVSRLPPGLPDRGSLLAAVAAAWALGLSPDLMRAGLATYDASSTAADAIVASVARQTEARGATSSTPASVSRGLPKSL